MANAMLRESLDDNVVKFTSPLSIKIVPDFIFRAMRNNNVNIVEISNYSKMRPLLSFEDLCLWELINENLTLTSSKGKIFLSTRALFEQDKLNEAQVTEYAKLVRPLSGSMQRVEKALSYLTSEPDLPDGWKVVTGTNDILVVVSASFTAQMANPETRKAFVSEYLKHCELLASINEVSSLPVFKEYLSLLRSF